MMALIAGAFFGVMCGWLAGEIGIPFPWAGIFGAAASFVVAYTLTRLER